MHSLIVIDTVAECLGATVWLNVVKIQQSTSGDYIRVK